MLSLCRKGLKKFRRKKISRPIFNSISWKFTRTPSSRIAAHEGSAKFLPRPHNRFSRRSHTKPHYYRFSRLRARGDYTPRSARLFKSAVPPRLFASDRRASPERGLQEARRPDDDDDANKNNNNNSNKATRELLRYTARRLLQDVGIAAASRCFRRASAERYASGIPADLPTAQAPEDQGPGQA